MGAVSDENGGCWLIRRPQLTAKVRVSMGASEGEREGRTGTGAVANLVLAALTDIRIRCLYNNVEGESSPVRLRG